MSCIRTPASRKRACTGAALVALERLRRTPEYRACQVDPDSDHLRQRRAAEPGVAVMVLFGEITALSYTGSLNLLYKYLNQGRAESDRIVPAPRRLTSWIMTPRDLPPNTASTSVSCSQAASS